MKQIAKIGVYCLIAFYAFTMKAQENNPLHLTLNHIALSVKNVDESALFYKTVLGLTEITNKTKKEGIRWFSLGEGKELHLVSTVKEPIVLNKAIHIAFTTTDFDALIAHLQALKLDYNDWEGTSNKITTRADGIKQIYIKDPNGYWIEINSVGQN
jgi:catechol-2,3-dioxygenase